MAKKETTDPRIDAAAEIQRVDAEREKMLPRMKEHEAATDKEVKDAWQLLQEAKAKARDARRSRARLANSLDNRERAARAVLTATADPRIAEFIDKVQFWVSTRRNEFFGATPEGMQRWSAAIQRCCDEARALQCTPSDDGKVEAMLAKWSADIATAESRIGLGRREFVDIGEQLSQAVKTAEPAGGKRYRVLD